MNFLRQRLSLRRDKSLMETQSGWVQRMETPSYGSGDRMELLSRDEIRCLKEWLADEKGSTGTTGRS